MMAYRTIHCKTQQCRDSASMMCEHEQVITAQYLLDQYKLHSLSFAQRQDNAKYSRAMDFQPVQHPGNCKTIPSERKDVSSNINELYLKPCVKATFDNSFSCTNSQCCSFSHQLFANHTRAGTGHIHL